MIDPIQILIIVVVSALTILLIVIGVQIVFILQEIRKSFQKVNKMLEIAFHDTDQRLLIGKTVSCAFLYAVLLWGVIEKEYAKLAEEMSPNMALHTAARLVLNTQQKFTALPRRFINDIIEIWQLQLRFSRRQPKTIWRTLASNRFRAGFYLLVFPS